jgi:hypothetical protein
MCICKYQRSPRRLTLSIDSNHIMNRLSVFTLAVAGANASILHKRQGFTSESPSEFADYMSNVCNAQDESGETDMNLPCNQITAIQVECSFGPKAGDWWRNQSGSDDDDGSENLAMLPYETQRVCICQSQHNDVLRGCFACQKAHGGLLPDEWINEDKIKEVTDKYCDADTPATDSYVNSIARALDFMAPNWDEIVNPASVTYSDPIGSSTDVSLYFTPSVTGTAAYVPVLPTGAGNSSNVTYTSSRTSGGLIIPTAIVGGEEGSSSGNEESSSVSGSGSSDTASSDGGALQTAMAHPGALGALGLAAIIAAL